MTSNSPFTRIEWVRRLCYRRYPEDLSPSALATFLGHAGTAVEFAVPTLLLLGHGGTTTLIGLVLMFGLHGFITSNFPMAVPLEWNVVMVYGGLFLFWEHADVSVLSASAPVALVLAVMCVAVPLLGNLFPSKIPFLLSMRYYAGNWAYSVWLFKKGAHRKLERLTKSSGWIYDQLATLYDAATCTGIVGKVMGFRLMHLHGRLLPRVVSRVVPNLADYDWIDGEIVAGIVLGWNFGDGHLHREDLLRAVQDQCGFEEGELRTVMVESQPLFGHTLHYRIRDAKTGLLEEGRADVRELRALQPWG